MPSSIAHISIEANSNLPLLTPGPEDCKDVLDKCGLVYIEDGPYLLVGKKPANGWVLHISTIRVQFSPLLKRILPILIDAKVAFKIPQNKGSINNFLDGSLGYQNLAKLICIYPENNAAAIELTKALIPATQDFRSIEIPTDKLLGGSVYTMYESIDIVRYNKSFRMPKDIRWPFDEFISLKKTKKSPLWNYKYKPLGVLKSDIKGRVIQGNYFKGFLNIKLCIIKEGIRNMWADEFGRDIVDRLQWQYDIYKDLENQIPTPKIFDIFQEEKNTYLAMEFIKGESLDHIILDIYDKNSFHHLDRSGKLKIIDYLLKIIVIIEKLHAKGYVHRDITPANFLITKRGDIYLIDMELAYSITRHKPDPAFKLGTPGYISPEQLQRETPTDKEDIYAIGCLIYFMFTGLVPVKLDQENEENALLNLNFLVEPPAIRYLISDCILKDPEKRPTLIAIKDKITSYRNHIQSYKVTEFQTLEGRRPILGDVIERALSGLNNSKVLSKEGVWLSRVNDEYLEGMLSIDRKPILGFYTGLAGILYTIGLAKKHKLNVEPCLETYYTSWRFIESNHLDTGSNITPGLYEGAAGIAVALNEGINCGLLSKDIYIPKLCSLFTDFSGNINISTGVAGQGISLLNCCNNLPNEFILPLLSQYIEVLLSTQHADGAWHILRFNGKRRDNVLGLSEGTSGILLFLITYYSQFQDDRVLLTVRKGLAWLIKQSKKRKGTIYWNISTKSKTDMMFDSSIGTPGVILTFLKAYEVFKEPLYKEIAIGALNGLPKWPVYLDFTRASGLSGLGEIYLEAYRILQNQEWIDRAEWIVNLFVNTFIGNNNSGYWIMNTHPELDVDLMTGTCGVIHLLLKYQTPEIEHLFPL